MRQGDPSGEYQAAEIPESRRPMAAWSPAEAGDQAAKFPRGDGVKSLYFRGTESVLTAARRNISQITHPLRQVS
jgi:hypothetical protein